MELGEKIYQQARSQSRVAKDILFKSDRVEPKGTVRKAGGTLRDSVNYKPLSDTVLLVAQVNYGKWNYPKGNNTKRTYNGKNIIITPEMNALQQAINDNIDETINLVVSEIMEQITANYDS